MGHDGTRYADGLAAEQLSPEAIWATLLSVAFRVWLQGKVLHPVMEGNQTLLLLTT